MGIWIGSLLEGATQASGAVAIIDVFRAFTTAAVVLANGAEKIIMVNSVAQAVSARQSGIGQLCMGEVRGRKPDEFDYGNSPLEVAAVDFHGRTVIQRTSAGTQGIVAATRADRLYAAALVTATATARALLSQPADRVSLVAMGDAGIARTDEDELCALHLRNLLQGRPGNPEAVRQLIQAGGEVARFDDPSRPNLHSGDVDIALDIDRYDFAIRVVAQDGCLVASIERA